MPVQQASFFCPICQQQRLFTRQGMNHTPHIIASVFLCGLWLPIWALIALSYNAMFHCSQCGHSDAAQYLANPYLRQQKARQAAPMTKQSDSFVHSFRHWFNNLHIMLRAVIITFSLLLLTSLSILIEKSEKSNRQSNSQTSTINTLEGSSNKTITPATPSTPSPSSLSSTDNLALGKKALSKGDLGTARSHLSIIPKEAKEFASAKQYLAAVERREKRKVVEDQLNSVKSDQAGVEQMLDATEDFGEQAGSPKKAIYLNALKRKGQLQLRRIELERKLKNMP
ncbi:MAG TPA: hypothetical protein VGB02_12315 [Pyrinomonadaceae bacterium]|jgi:hypothetical protein